MIVRIFNYIYAERKSGPHWAFYKFLLDSHIYIRHYIYTCVWNCFVLYNKSIPFEKHYSLATYFWRTGTSSACRYLYTYIQIYQHIDTRIDDWPVNGNPDVTIESHYPCPKRMLQALSRNKIAHKTPPKRYCWLLWKRAPLLSATNKQINLLLDKHSNTHATEYVYTNVYVSVLAVSIWPLLFVY